jgi:hypothetical protein
VAQLSVLIKEEYPGVQSVALTQPDGVKWALATQMEDVLKAGYSTGGDETVVPPGFHVQMDTNKLPVRVPSFQGTI